MSIQIDRRARLGERPGRCRDLSGGIDAGPVNLTQESIWPALVGEDSPTRQNAPVSRILTLVAHPVSGLRCTVMEGTAARHRSHRAVSARAQCGVVGIGTVSTHAREERRKAAFQLSCWLGNTLADQANATRALAKRRVREVSPAGRRAQRQHEHAEPNTCLIYPAS